MMSLVAVLALMLGVILVMKKFMYRSGAGDKSDVAIDVLGQRSLHPKRSVVVLRVLNTVLVVGMSEQGMQTLATIDDEETLTSLDQKKRHDVPEQRWLLWQGGGSQVQRPFAEHVRRAIKNILQKEAVGTPVIHDESPRVKRVRRNP